MTQKDWILTNIRMKRTIAWKKLVRNEPPLYHMVSVSPAVWRGGGWILHITLKIPKTFKLKRNAIKEAKEYMRNN